MQSGLSIQRGLLAHIISSLVVSRMVCSGLCLNFSVVLDSVLVLVLVGFVLRLPSSMVVRVAKKATCYLFTNINFTIFLSL